MATFLFDQIIFGPVKSRRLGVSLGINLMPSNQKICNFDCIYCECGRNKSIENPIASLPGRMEVCEALAEKLRAMKAEGTAPDVITYAGNGEPTIHPEFAGIIDDSIRLRDEYFPNASIAVLSNSTNISSPQVRKALLRIDKNILKLDSAVAETIMIMNNPGREINVRELIKNLASFNGMFIIQTMFLRGTIGGRTFDNTTSVELKAWIEAIAEIKPSEVMIYTISRDTPEVGHMEKIPLTELQKIADMVEELGISTQVSG